MATKAKPTASPKNKPQANADSGEQPVHLQDHKPGKSAASKVPAAPPAQRAVANEELSKRLSEATVLLQNSKHKEAQAAFETLLVDAKAVNHLGMLRTIRTSLSAIQHRLTAPTASGDNLEAQATYHLNRHDAPAALELLQKALAQRETPYLHYLMATAQVLNGQPETGAEWLKKAVEADSGFLNLFHLEQDFDDVRYSTPFAAFERE